MAGLVPAIHAQSASPKTWMPGTRPGMTFDHRVPRDTTFSSVATIAAASPAIFTRLIRAVAPPTIATRPGATPAALARSRTSAAFASPSRGAARTRAWSTQPPSARRAMPSSASRPPLGVRRTASTTPSPTMDHGRAGAGKASDHVGIDVIDDHPLDQDDDQEQDDRRNVDPAQIGQKVADRAQHRLGDAIEELGHPGDERVARVDDVEGDQPGEDRRRDDDPNVDIEGDQNDVEERAHG